jgi:hypothetical protein
MLTGTLLSIFFVPLFFIAIRRVFKIQDKAVAPTGPPPDAPGS